MIYMGNMGRGSTSATYKVWSSSAVLLDVLFVEADDSSGAGFSTLTAATDWVPEGGERESQAQSSRCYTVSLEALHCPEAALRVDLRQAEGQTRKVRKLKVKKKKE